MNVTKEAGSGITEAIEALQEVAARPPTKPNGFILLYVPDPMSDEGGVSDLEILTNFPVDAATSVLEHAAEQVGDYADTVKDSPGSKDDDDPLDDILRAVLEAGTDAELKALLKPQKDVFGLLLLSALLSPGRRV